MSSILRTEIQDPVSDVMTTFSDWPLKPLKCELDSPDTDWNKTWRLSRQRGLGPELTSFLLKVLWKLTPTRSRLHRILPRLYATSDCQLCPQGQGPEEETLEHALGNCTANQGLPQRLLQVLQVYQPGATQRTVLTLDLELDASLEFPMTWAIGTLLFSFFSQREEGRVTVARTQADLESRCRFLRESEV